MSTTKKKTDESEQSDVTLLSEVKSYRFRPKLITYYRHVVLRFSEITQGRGQDQIYKFKKN